MPSAKSTKKVSADLSEAPKVLAHGYDGATWVEIAVDSNGVVQVNSGATALTAGRKLVAVTNTAIVLGSAACRTIWINALTTNANVVVIGGSGVVFTEASRTGKILYPGDGMTIDIDNLSKLYVNGTANDGISFSYTT